MRSGNDIKASEFKAKRGLITPRLLSILGVLFIIFIVIWTLLPIYWLVLTSFKTLGDVISYHPKLIIDYIYIKNYILVLTELGYAKNLINSIIIAAGSIALNLSLSFLAAYAFSRFKVTGDKHIYFWAFTNRMAPPAVFMVPYWLMFTTLGLWDTYQGMLIIYSVFNLPIAIWMLKGFIDGIPKELDEAALIDGHGYRYVIGRIIFPLSKVGLIATALFIFLFSWSEFLFASTLTSVTAKTLPAALYKFLSAAGTPYAEMSATGVIAMIPGLIVAAIASRYIVSGLTLGMVK